MRSTGRDNPRVAMETNIIKNLITSYFNVVRKNISDIIPKTIMNFLINESRRIAQSELVNAIYQDNKKEELLVEDPIVVQNRINCQKVIDALRQAQALLNEARQFRA